MALHATSSSLRSSSAADEQPPESDMPRKQPVAKPPKRHVATPPPTQADASIEAARNIIKAVKRLTGIDGKVAAKSAMDIMYYWYTAARRGWGGARQRWVSPEEYII